MFRQKAGVALDLFKKRFVYGLLLRNYGITQHRALLKNVVRSQSHTYTRFRRSPGQLEALAGPVMEYLSAGRVPGPIRINVFACSSGAEVYTLASTLLKRFPGLDFRIVASDLHQEMIDRANAAIYSAEEVLGGTPASFVAETFVKEGDSYRVKPEIQARATFKQANLLDPTLTARIEPSDIVCLQNVLCHLDQPLATQVFRAAVRFLKPKSALFVDGMELDLRETLTVEAGLRPLDFKVRQIHEHACGHIDERWWNVYYGIEPYSARAKNRLRRFSTIFLKGE